MHCQWAARAVTAASILAALVGCGSDAPPPASEAFLRYLQFANVFATELQTLKSAKDYQAKREAYNKHCADLEGFQSKFQALPPDQLQPLRQEYAELVKRTREQCGALTRWHAKSPAILGQDWARIDRALRDANGT